MGMYFLKKIHPHLSVNGEGRVPNSEFQNAYSGLLSKDHTTN